MNTKICLVGAGSGYSYGSAGTTHHAIEDIAIMRALPNMTVCSPGDPWEAECIFKESFSYKSPIYIRLAKSEDPLVHDKKTPIKIGKSIIIKEGNDFAIIATGTIINIVNEWVIDWNKKGIKPMFISMPTIKPFDFNMIYNLIEKKIPIVTIEEHNIIGGLGSAVAEVIAESGVGIKFKRVGVPDIYTHEVGSQNYLMKKVGITKENVEKFLNI